VLTLPHTRSRNNSSNSTGRLQQGTQDCIAVPRLLQQISNASSGGGSGGSSSKLARFESIDSLAMVRLDNPYEQPAADLAGTAAGAAAAAAAAPARAYVGVYAPAAASGSQAWSISTDDAACLQLLPAE
jgi:hypothetical protein